MQDFYNIEFFPRKYISRDYRPVLFHSICVLKSIRYVSPIVIYNILFIFYNFYQTGMAGISVSTAFVACTVKVFAFHNINILCGVIITKLSTDELFIRDFDMPNLYRCQIMLSEYVKYFGIPKTLEYFVMFEKLDVMRFIEEFEMIERFYELNCEELFLFFISCRCGFVFFAKNYQEKFNMVIHQKKRTSFKIRLP